MRPELVASFSALRDAYYGKSTHDPALSKALDAAAYELVSSAYADGSKQIPLDALIQILGWVGAADRLLKFNGDADRAYASTLRRSA